MQEIEILVWVSAWRGLWHSCKLLGEIICIWERIRPQGFSHGAKKAQISIRGGFEIYAFECQSVEKHSKDCTESSESFYPCVRVHDLCSPKMPTTDSKITHLSQGTISEMVNNFAIFYILGPIIWITLFTWCEPWWILATAKCTSQLAGKKTELECSHSL